MEGHEEFKTAGITIELLYWEIAALNKSLGIDCTKYDENGEPIMFKDSNGETHVLESLPDSLQLR